MIKFIKFIILLLISLFSLLFIFVSCKGYYITKENCYKSFPYITVDSTFVIDTKYVINHDTIQTTISSLDSIYIYQDSLIYIEETLNTNKNIKFKYVIKTDTINIKIVNTDSLLKIINNLKSNELKLKSIIEKEDSSFFNFNNPNLLFIIIIIVIIISHYIIRKIS